MTNLVVTTDRRTYMIELRAREALYMPSVAWAYPAQPASQRQTVPAAPIIPAGAARNYRYGLTGDSPPWKPISVFDDGRRVYVVRSEEHTSELQSLMRISYAVFCLKKKKNTHKYT